MSGFIAGDWGTSHLRLTLCDEAGTPLETNSGPGVAALDRKLAAAFLERVAAWDQKCGVLPAVLCGMAGSTLGWREAPYLACPIRPEMIVDSALRFDDAGRRIVIAPGLSCRNRLMSPDVIRGEETQILGALRLDPQLREDIHILCLPGTHTKWVILRDGVIEHFLTGMTGELFDILSRHSVLVGKPNAPAMLSRPAFDRALEQTALHPDAELIHLLFQVRSRQVAGELKPRDATAFLSGLVIGQDVAGAVRLYRNELAGARGVVIIGSTDLSDLYAAALARRDIRVARLDGNAASLAGLAELHTAHLQGLAHAS
jgi:2-dehydro-3-deoxygalactonokinase